MKLLPVLLIALFAVSCGCRHIGGPETRAKNTDDSVVDSTRRAKIRTDDSVVDAAKKKADIRYHLEELERLRNLPGERKWEPENSLKYEDHLAKLVALGHLQRRFFPFFHLVKSGYIDHHRPRIMEEYKPLLPVESLLIVGGLDEGYLGVIVIDKPSRMGRFEAKFRELEESAPKYNPDWTPDPSHVRLVRFHVAVRYRNFPVVKKYLQEGGDPNKELGGRLPLHSAVRSKKIEMVKLLLASGATVNGVAKGASKHHGQEGSTALHTAFQCHNYEAAELLIKRGADITARNKHGKTVLHEACNSKPDLRLTKVLIDARADVNAKDEDGNTPLHDATWRSNVAMLELLIKAGAEVNAKSKSGTTPLHKACWGASFYSGNADLVKLLVRHGADIQARNRYGETPLHSACSLAGAGNLAVVKFLIAKGVDTEAMEERHGYSPLAVAAKADFAEAGKLLGKPTKKLPRDDEIELIGLRIFNYLQRRVRGGMPTFVSFDGRAPRDESLKKMQIAGLAIHKAAILPPSSGARVNMADITDKATGQRGRLFTFEIKNWVNDFEVEVRAEIYEGTQASRIWPVRLEKKYGIWVITEPG